LLSILYSKGEGIKMGKLLGIVALICAIWVIYDVLANNKGLSTGMKVVWIICALLFSIITAIVYYLVEKKK
jgi:uncharacterized membrane protein